jgi:hypothetical protein
VIAVINPVVELTEQTVEDNEVNDLVEALSELDEKVAVSVSPSK